MQCEIFLQPDSDALFVFADGAAWKGPAQKEYQVRVAEKHQVPL